MVPGTGKWTDSADGSRDVKVDNGVHYANWSTQNEWTGSAAQRYRAGTSAQGDGIGILNRSDDFNDGVLDSGRWRVNYSSGAEVSEADGVLWMNIPSSTASKTAYAVVEIKDDFDISVNYSINNWGDEYLDSVYAFGFAMDLGPGYDQVSFYRAFLGSETYGNPGENLYEILSFPQGGGAADVWAQQSTSDTSGSIRFQRSGTTFRAYIWTGSWTELGSRDMGTGYNGTGAMGLQLFSMPATYDTNPYVNVSFDDYSVQSGPGFFDYGYFDLDYQAEGMAHFMNYSYAATFPDATTYAAIRVKVAGTKADLEGASWSEAYGGTEQNFTQAVPDGPWIRLQVYMWSDSQTTTCLVTSMSLRYTLVPDPPNVIGPADQTWTNGTPVFSWAFSDPDIGDNQTGFRVQIDDVSSFLAVNYESGPLENGTSNWSYPTRTSLVKISDGTWYWRMKAKDPHGGWSNWSVYRTMKVESLAPSASISTPASGASLPTITEFKGGATDQGGSGVAKVEISLAGPDGKFWNGTSWNTVEGWLATTGGASWSYKGPFPLWYANLTYTLKARATDNAGNVQTSIAKSTFSMMASGIGSWIDEPISGGFYNHMPVVTGGAVDSSGGSITKVEVSVVDEKGASWNGTAWTNGTAVWHKAVGTTSWNLELPNVTLATGSSFTVASRATSSKGLVEAPSVGATFTFDDVTPMVDITWPKPGMDVFRLTYVEGEAMDEGGSWVDKVLISIQLDRDGTYWNGTTWSAEASFVEATFTPSPTGTGPGRYIIGDGLPPMEWDTGANVTVWAMDAAGNSGEGYKAANGTGRSRLLYNAAEVFFNFAKSGAFRPPDLDFAKDLDPMDVDEFLDKNPCPTLGDWYAWVVVIEAAKGAYGGPIHLDYDVYRNALTGDVEIQIGDLSNETELGNGWKIAGAEVNITITGSITLIISVSSEGFIETKAHGEIEAALNVKYLIAEMPIAHTAGILWGKFTVFGYVKIVISAEGGVKDYSDQEKFPDAVVNFNVDGDVAVGVRFDLGLEQHISKFIAIDLSFIVMLCWHVYEKSWGTMAGEEDTPLSLAFNFTIEHSFSILGNTLYTLTLFSMEWWLYNKADEQTGDGINVSADFLGDRSRSLPEGGTGTGSRDMDIGDDGPAVSRADDFTPPDEFPTKVELRQWTEGLPVKPVKGSSEVFPGTSVTKDTAEDGIPTIAVSPTGRILSTWAAIPEGSNAGHIRVAEWDGNTWEQLPDVTPSTESTMNGNPTISFTADGAPLVVWSHSNTPMASDMTAIQTIQAANNMELVWSVYKDGEWSAPIAITQDNAADTSPALASDGNGGPILVWTKEGLADQAAGAEDWTFGRLASSEVWTSEWSSTNDGSFSAPSRLSAQGDMAFVPSLAVSEDGKATVVWPQQKGNEPETPRGLYYSDYRDGAWGTPKTLSTVTGESVAAVSISGGDGDLAVAYVTDAGENGTIEVRTRDGDAWKAAEIVADKGGFGRPSVALTGKGEVAVAWENRLCDEPDSEIVWAMKVDGEWTGPMNLTDDDVDDTTPILPSNLAIPMVLFRKNATGSDHDIYMVWMKVDEDDTAGFVAAVEPFEVKVKAGESITIKVTLTNVGKGSVVVKLSLEGIDKGWSKLPAEVSLREGETKTIDVTISPSSSAKAMTGNVRIVFTGAGMSQKVDVGLEVEAKGGGGGPIPGTDGQGGFGILLYIIIGVVIAVVAISASVGIRRRRKR